MDHDYDFKTSFRRSVGNTLTSADISIYGVFPDLPNGTLDGNVTGNPLRIQPIAVNLEAGMARIASTDGIWFFSKGANIDH